MVGYILGIFLYLAVGVALGIVFVRWLFKDQIDFENASTAVWAYVAFLALMAAPFWPIGLLFWFIGMVLKGAFQVWSKK